MRSFVSVAGLENIMIVTCVEIVILLDTIERGSVDTIVFFDNINLVFIVGRFLDHLMD